MSETLTDKREKIEQALTESERVYIIDLAGSIRPDCKVYWDIAHMMERRELVKICHDWRKRRNYLITFPEICCGCTKIDRCSKEPSGEKQFKEKCDGPHG